MKKRTQKAVSPLNICNRRPVGAGCLIALFAFLGALAGLNASEQRCLNAQESGASLIGVWEAEQTFNHHQARTITLQKTNEQWFATLGDTRCKVNNQSENLSFELSNGGGKFRGKISKSDQSVTGFWIQPITTNLNYPLATPLRFDKLKDTWKANVQPLRDRLRFYLVVSKPHGKPVEAFIRNPERNVGIRIGYLSVRMNNNNLELKQMRGESSFKGKRTVTNSDESIAINLPYSQKPFIFRRARRTSDSGFYPAESSNPYRYLKPKRVDDGWDVAAAGELGFDTSRLETMVQELRGLETSELTTPYIHSVLISRRGKLVFEEYFYGYNRTQTHDTRSAGKSVGSMIVGTVVDRDETLSENSTLASLFGNAFQESKSVASALPYAKRSDWRERITIANALAMQSGLEADDETSNSLFSEDRMQDQTQEPDWIKWAMNTPMFREPGTRSFYASNSINLASAAVARKHGAWLPDLFEMHLAKPLGIHRYHCNLDPAEQGYMGGGIRLTPRDQLKLGQVMLDGGRWKGQQILSERWVEESTRPHGSIHEPNDYGMGWWRKSLNVGSKQVKVIHAGGNGGQLIVCIPEYQMVVQISGGNYSNFAVWYRNLTELIPQKILPAIK